jgi:hypothetical protein
LIDGRTLQVDLSLTLELSQQLVKGSASAWHSTLCTHAVARASETASALIAAGESDGALLFNIDRRFWSKHSCLLEEGFGIN